MSVRRLTAVVHQEENLFVAECPEIGTVSQGKSVEEAVANLKEATELYLEEFPQEGPNGTAVVTSFEAEVA
ncbi:MAG: type II toxin-antitoxin system HicB family antitoxin [Terriglobales bacterium]